MAKQDRTMPPQSAEETKDKKNVEARKIATGIVKHLTVPEKDKAHLVNALVDAGYTELDLTAQRLGSSLSMTLRTMYREVLKVDEREKYNSQEEHDFLREWHFAYAIATDKKTETQIESKRNRQSSKRLSQRSG